MADTYLSQWGQVLLFIIGGLLFVTIVLTVARIVRPDRPNSEKLSTYESGEEPRGTAWVQFNLRFYIIALVFILFEAEIIFLFPWATVFSKKELLDQTNGAWGWFALVEMIIFVAVLALGLGYAWVNGYLDWIKPDVDKSDFKSPVPREFYEKLNERYKKK